MTIEEAISLYEESERINKELAEQCVSAIAKNHNLDNAEKCRQMIAWLRELQELRKAPEIIRCKDCKHYEWMSNRIPEEQTWHCHCWDADTGKDDFCSYAERRIDG